MCFPRLTFDCSTWQNSCITQPAFLIRLPTLVLGQRLYWVPTTTIFLAVSRLHHRRRGKSQSAYRVHRTYAVGSDYNVLERPAIQSEKRRCAGCSVSTDLQAMMEHFSLSLVFFLKTAQLSRSWALGSFLIPLLPFHQFMS